MQQPTRSNQRGTRRRRKEIEPSSKKCDKKVKAFTDKKARIKAIGKEQLNTITAIHSKALKQSKTASNTGTNNSNDFKTGAWTESRTYHFTNPLKMPQP